MIRTPLMAGTYAALLLRDGSHCYLCGQPPDLDDPLEVEHKKPVARGGTNDLANLGLAHRSCNRWKGNRPGSPMNGGNLT